MTETVIGWMHIGIVDGRWIVTCLRTGATLMVCSRFQDGTRYAAREVSNLARRTNELPNL